MEIIYLGHACFKIKTTQTTLIVDPFDPAMVGMKLSTQEADVVLTTHDHNDHNFLAAVKGYRKAIDGPGEYEVGSISVIGYPAYHDNEKGEKRGKNTIYLIEAGDIRILHLGDIGHNLSEKTIEEIGEVNILLIPVGNGAFTIGPKQAVEIIRDLEPQITIPMHYQTPQTNKDNFPNLLPLDDFLKESGKTAESMPKLSIKVSDLAEEQKIIVLEKR